MRDNCLIDEEPRVGQDAVKAGNAGKRSST